MALLDIILFPMIASVAILLVFVIYQIRNSVTNVPVETEYAYKNGAVGHFKTAEDFEAKTIRIIWKGKVTGEKQIVGLPHEVRTGLFTRKRRYYAMEGCNDTIDPFNLERMVGDNSLFFGYVNKMMSVVVACFEAMQKAMQKGKIGLFTNIFWLPTGLILGVLMAVLLKIHV